MEAAYLTTGRTGVLIFSAVAGLAIYYLFFGRKKSNASSFSQADLDELLQRRVPIGSDNAGPNANSAPRDADFVGKMVRTGKNIAVFYGSQTGTAEEFAVRLVKSAQKYGLKGLAVDPEEVEDWDVLATVSAKVERGLLVFCMATYGEGEPTDNAMQLHEWLRESETKLEGVRYCVFALGNRTYEHFNSMGVLVDKRLEEMGAERLCDIGLGDDDQNIEDDFVQWQESTFWQSVKSAFHIESEGEFASVRQYQMNTFSNNEKHPERTFTGEPARFQSFQRQRPPYEAKNPFLARVNGFRKLNKDSERLFFHLELDTTGSRMRYDSGDHVAILPANPAGLVDRLATCLDINLDDVFSLVNVDPDDSKKYPFPCPTSFRTAFSHYLDISSHPTTIMCRELAEYATVESERDFLLQLSTNNAEGKDMYHKWVRGDNRTIIEVLEELKSVKVPVDHLCELLPRLQVRYYSIASSAKVHPTNVHVTAVLVDYETPIGREVKGICTEYMRLKGTNGGNSEAESEDEKVACYIRKSQFRLPMKTTVPVVLIGPGTGFAPFRGFLQEKHWQKQQGKPLGEVVLFYGCRNSERDFIYEEEVKAWTENGTISHLFTAFSRDQQKKVYVQHRLAENGELIWELLSKGGHVYICGDAKHMARDVYACLEDIISKYGDMSKEKATQYIKNMSNKGRYSADVWS